ncbi:glycosyltransferase involved in cell wall biosynthesis [Streptomyces ambofaciens]
MHVLVVHNRYNSAQPSGENNVVDQEVELLRAAGHRVGVFERRSDDIAARSLPGKAAVPLLVPWNPAVRRELAARLRAERPDVVHVHNVFPLLSPAVLAACADAGVPAVATLHNYTQVCPPGTLQREGRPCTECVGATPLPAVRHGCYRGSRLATVPLAVSLSANRRRWWSGVERFFCISAAQRDVLVRSGMPAERLAVKHNFVPEPEERRAGAGEHLLYLGRLAEAKGVRLLMAAWDELAAAQGVGVPLVIAGTGPLEREVTAWAAGRDDVRYVGLYDPEQCRRALARSVAVVAPSTWLEAFGLVVVEAMAAGGPGRRRRARRVRRTRRGPGDRAAAPPGRVRLARGVPAPDHGGAGPEPGDGPGGPAPLRAGVQPGRRAGAPAGGVPHRDRGAVGTGSRRGHPRGQGGWGQ